MHKYAILVWNLKAGQVVTDRGIWSANKVDLSTTDPVLVDRRAYMSAWGS